MIFNQIKINMHSLHDKVMEFYIFKYFSQRQKKFQEGSVNPEVNPFLRDNR